NLWKTNDNGQLTYPSSADRELLTLNLQHRIDTTAGSVHLIATDHAREYPIASFQQASYKVITEMAPNLVLAIFKRTRKQRTVFQALTNRRWVKDIRGALTVQVLVEYVKVWEMVDDVILEPGVPDHFRWRFTQSGQYSCKSAYQSFFLGTVKTKEGSYSLIILVAWEVWKHRNACVFEEIRPCVSVICQEIEKEGSLWCLAGNSALSSLRARMGRLGL
ncbi:hypothetical protein U9M48_005288, partial [Paspalum notatum var. saurae]